MSKKELTRLVIEKYGDVGRSVLQDCENERIDYLFFIYEGKDIFKIHIEFNKEGSEFYSKILECKENEKANSSEMKIKKDDYELFYELFNYYKLI